MPLVTVLKDGRASGAQGLRRFPVLAATVVAILAATGIALAVVQLEAPSARGHSLRQGVHCQVRACPASFRASGNRPLDSDGSHRGRGQGRGQDPRSVDCSRGGGHTDDIRRRSGLAIYSVSADIGGCGHSARLPHNCHPPRHCVISAWVHKRLAAGHCRSTLQTETADGSGIGLYQSSCLTKR